MSDVIRVESRKNVIFRWEDTFRWKDGELTADLSSFDDDEIKALRNKLMEPHGKSKKHDKKTPEISLDKLIDVSAIDVGIEQMRQTIPLLLKKIDERGRYRHLKKTKGIWNKKPTWWDEKIPFLDPNNGKKCGNGKAKKPTKEELMPMWQYLIDKYKDVVCRGPSSVSKYQQVADSPGYDDDMSAEGNVSSVSSYQQVPDDMAGEFDEAESASPNVCERENYHLHQSNHCGTNLAALGEHAGPRNENAVDASTRNDQLYIPGFIEGAGAFAAELCVEFNDIVQSQYLEVYETGELTKEILNPYLSMPNDEVSKDSLDLYPGPPMGDDAGERDGFDQHQWQCLGDVKMEFELINDECLAQMQTDRNWPD